MNVLSYKDFLNESSELLTEITKKEVLDYMSHAKWDKTQAYAFSRQAVSHGLFKNENSALNAFNKNFDEYSKMSHGNSKAAFVGSNGVLNLMSKADYLKGHSGAARPATPSPAQKAAVAAKPVVPKVAKPAAAPKSVPGADVNSGFAIIKGSQEFYTQAMKVAALLPDSAALYKSLNTYMDNLYKFNESQFNSKPNTGDLNRIGDIKVKMASLRYALIKLAEDARVSYRM